MTLDYDVIVVGSGAGGGTAALELARAGRRVLLVERGRPIADTGGGRDEQRMLIEREGCDDRTLRVNGVAARPLVGGGPGGSTALFGAALLRPGPSDLAPGRHYGSRLPRALWDWPIDLEQLAPYLDRAEDLFHVAGDHRVATPHLHRRLRPYIAPAPAYVPIARRLAGGLVRAGLTPFPLPLAIDFSRCIRCPGCPGYRCPTGARASSWKNAIEPARETGRLDVWLGCEAEELRRAGRGVRALRVRFRADGREEEPRARAYLLAAGALGTPLLLMRSGLEGRSGQLGRNHMCHIGAVGAAVFARPTGAAEHFAKQVGMSDDYLGFPGMPHKLGYAQMVPVPGPLSLRAQLRMPLPHALARALHARALLLVGSVEDLPDPANRVRPGPGVAVHLTRRFGDFDVWRARRWARRLASLLRQVGAPLAFGHAAARAHDHLAHQVGTCRFGRDPATSVLDAQCRLHDCDGVYVVDGSFMPTSLGVGPALTIAANALRVADHVHKAAL